MLRGKFSAAWIQDKPQYLAPKACIKLHRTMAKRLRQPTIAHEQTLLRCGSSMATIFTLASPPLGAEKKFTEGGGKGKEKEKPK